MNDGLNLALVVEKKLRSGNCSVQIAKALLDRHAWGAAARALKTGIAKGDLDDYEEATSLLRQCRSMLAG